jgi:hypothetical protein
VMYLIDLSTSGSTRPTRLEHLQTAVDRWVGESVNRRND